MWPLLSVLILSGVATYWNGLTAPFVYDDELSVVENQSIRQLRFPEVWYAEQDTPTAGRPLVNLSFALNYAITGLDVRTYHAFNLAIHLACALALFGLVRRTLELPEVGSALGARSRDLAFAAALIWTVHPLNSEVVEYVTERTESMMALCYLSTMYAGVRAVHAERRVIWFAAAVLSCAAGMACKESMVTAPVMMMLYDSVYVYGSAKTAFSKRWLFYLALAATWTILGALMWSDPRGGSAGFSGQVSPWTYLLNQAVVIPEYLHKTIWPRSLVAGYGWPVPLALVDVFPYAVLMLGLLLLTVVAFLRIPKVGILGVWFFVTLAPTSSVIPIPTEVGAERRMYLPLAGLAVAGAVGAFALLQSLEARYERSSRTFCRRTVRYGGVIALLLTAGALTAGTIARNREYSSPLTLYRTVVERRPTSLSHHILGSALMTAGFHEEAVAHLRAALPGAPRAHYDLGVEMFNQGRFDEAIQHLETLIGVRDTPPVAHPYWQAPVRGDEVGARLLIGRALAQQQRWREASEQFEQVVSMAPTHVEAHKLLAGTLFSERSFEQSIVHYQTYLQSRPDDVDALTNLAIALTALDRHEEAITAFGRAVAIEPANGRLQRNLANALVDHGNVIDGASHAATAVSLRPDDAEAHDLLGRALAMQGELEEAIGHFRRALALDPDYDDAREHLKAVQRLSPD